ncbi:hypothetical protein [Bifidobacterium xylocopae]|uniref:Uncharacterized protein n=1 Tax=Bifidobacterium xylocopae TaxID=2493119 RepID=A0A366KDG6_9BIFI|nr:hypothetical protein [Bifidobacterium xylocopae]RBP99785.1 hypothetical protein CRD59_01735 [Bifidobacterium xylocopae]
MLIKITFALLASRLYGGLVRVWTGLLPPRVASWSVARRQTVSRIGRSSSVLAPLMVCVGLIMGLGTPLRIFNDSLMKVAGYPTLPGTTSTGMAGVLGAIGPAAAIALGGTLAGFCMISRERSLDQALLGIAGAEPRQLLMSSGLEGAIIMLTAMPAAFLAAVPATICAYLGFRAILGTAVLSVPWAQWAWMIFGVVVLGSGVFLRHPHVPWGSRLCWPSDYGPSRWIPL